MVPVSYTHLDVYKRQLLSGKAGGEKKAEKGSTGGALYLLCSYAYESDVSGKNTDGY